MQIMEQDGIDQGSEIHCKALYLISWNACNRRAFTTLKTKEARLNWINFNWNMLSRKG